MSFCGKRGINASGDNGPLPSREREGTHEVGRVRGGPSIPNRMVPCTTPHPSHAPHGPLPSPGAGEGANCDSPADR
ncbi:hypothetical protein [Azospirillum endophyticum]